MLDPEVFGKAMAAIVREATAPLLQRIELLEARQLVKGDRGDPGAAGRDAEPIEVADVAAEILAGDEMSTLVDLHVAEAVQRYFEENPVRHGKDGEPGKPGDKGDAIKGEPGNDGVGLAGAIIDRDGELVITTTKGDAIKLGRVVGADGEAGKDGGDFSDASIDYDGERGLVIRSKGGTEIVRRLPIPMDKGYWREGMACEKADILTHGGNAWIALKDTDAKPCIEAKDDWRLFARKGRDGTDGTNGRDLGPQPPVKLGANGGA
jgi:hypothetical protein